MQKKIKKNFIVNYLKINNLKKNPKKDLNLFAYLFALFNN